MTRNSLPRRDLADLQCTAERLTAVLIALEMCSRPSAKASQRQGGQSARLAEAIERRRIAWNF